METWTCIKSRRSIRKYLATPVEWEKICQVIEAGMAAPSAGNLQSWKFIVVSDQGVRNKLAEASLQQYWMATAPVSIVICADIDKTKMFYGIRGENLYIIQNCAAAVQNMLLEAHELGLGACWVGAFDENAVCRIVGIPDRARPQVIITLGYPDGQTPEPMEYQLTDMLYIGKYGSRIKDMDAVLGYYSAKIGVDKIAGHAVKGATYVGKGMFDAGKGLFQRVKGKKK